jgi:predicted MPP superfamily phosphohydrolase
MQLVLRFANRESVNTIALHDEVIRARGDVWWGWFRKAHEPFPLRELQGLANELPVEVGLVNRDENAFYLAKCIEVELTDKAGTAIPSPDEAGTPHYYSDAYLPAWFRLADITAIHLDTFTAKFGGIPEGDPTLFLVHSAAAGPETSLPDAPPRALEPRGQSILHISDLHFGEFHGFPAEPSPGAATLQSILTDFLAGRKDLSIGGVVASGDFVSKGNANNFPSAESFLHSIIVACKLDLGYLIVVPGNHDIWLQGTDHFDRDYRVENPYRMFLRSLYGQDVKEIEGLSSFQTSTGWVVTFLGLNSARARSEASKEYGYVGPDRYGPWLDRLTRANGGRSASELISDHRLNVVVLHHHLLPAGLVSRPAESRPVSLTLDAGAIVADLQDSGVHVALHGHEHLPFVGTTGRMRRHSGNRWDGPERWLTVLGSGSTGANVSQLSPEEPLNAFSVYTPLKASLRVQVFTFNTARPPDTFLDVELPL